MFYGKLFDPNMPESAALGIGMFIRFAKNEGGELLHILKFLAKYAAAENITSNEHLPSIVAGGNSFLLGKVLAEVEETTEQCDDLVVDIEIHFYDRHQPIFKQYTRELAGENGPVWKNAKKVYAAAEKAYFPNFAQVN